MRIARFDIEGDPATHVGLVLDGTVCDLTSAEPAFGDDVVAVAMADRSRVSRIAAGAPEHDLSAVRLLAPVPRPPKFLAIGLNYSDHIAETGQSAPEFPVFFNKQSTCVIGPGAAIHKPRASQLLDYEGELGFVIGRRCRHVPAGRADEVIAGYLIVDDVSARDWQFRAPTMTLGKSFDTHGPTGPWLVTPDEIPDSHNLRIRTWVNGDLRQDASTSEMIFDVHSQIETLSTVFTLEPGDIVATGTPAGVGIARQPPSSLQPGDTVRISIDGIGTLENPVVEEPGDTQLI